MNLWDQVLIQLRAELTGAEFDTWLRDTELLARKGDKLEIRVPNDRTAAEISARFGARIREILDQLSSARTFATFVSDASSSQSSVSLPSHSTPVHSAPEPELVSSVFNPRYKFETFVQGP
jgi:chromosomal replication initiator protein